MPPKTLLLECFKQIIDHCYKQQEQLTNRQLLEICEPVCKFSNGDLDPHYPHEIAETALNFLIQDSLAGVLLSSANPEGAYLETIKPLASRLPTQTWRSVEQNVWQQFSTPPGIAFLLIYLLNLRRDDEVLEPSAGTGSLAVWARGIGAKTDVNEIDERRRSLLECLGFEPTSYNAEHIHDYLPASIEPDCVIMNPPFSANGGRTKNNSSKFGFRHVSSAIERLKTGGKFGIILGDSARLNKRAGRKFWNSLSESVHLKTIINVNGKEYAKNGTCVDVNLFIGTKRTMYQNLHKNGRSEPENAITTFSIPNIEAGFTAAKQMGLRLD